MLKLLQKVMDIGIVTESYDAAPVPVRSRGEVVLEAGATCASNCAICCNICPTQAIQVNSGQLTIDHRACIFCGACVEQCEQNQMRKTGNYKLAKVSGQLDREIGRELRSKITRVLGRSLHIRHLDVGSCNACDFEMAALNSPVYDLQQYGIDFVASPRHADLLMVTGVVTRNLKQALHMTYEATPTPKLVMAVGACAASGKTFGKSYAITGGVDEFVPVDIYVPGCPPRPQALLYGLLLALDRL